MINYDISLNGKPCLCTFDPSSKSILVEYEETREAGFTEPITRTIRIGDDSELGQMVWQLSEDALREKGVNLESELNPQEVRQPIRLSERLASKVTAPKQEPQGQAIYEHNEIESDSMIRQAEQKLKSKYSQVSDEALIRSQRIVLNMIAAQCKFALSEGSQFDNAAFEMIQLSINEVNKLYEQWESQ